MRSKGGGGRRRKGKGHEKLPIRNNLRKWLDCEWKCVTVTCAGKLMMEEVGR